MKECQEQFRENEIIEGDIVTFRCDKGLLEMQVDTFGDWDYHKSQEFVEILKASIKRGCKEKCRIFSSLP